MPTTKHFSDWMRIDLHIHTDKSKETKNTDYWGAFSVAKLKEKLKDNNVSIFSLTDHNIINTAAYTEYVDAYSTDSNDPFPMLGFEADIEVEVLNENKNYHALVVFADDITKNKDLINTIAVKLETAYQHIPDKKNRRLTFEQLIDAFNDDEFLLIVHSGSHQSIVEAYRGDIATAQKKVLVLENMGIEQGNEEKKRIFQQGFQKHLEKYLDADNYVPYLDFSDNHNIEQYPCRHSSSDKGVHSFYYIKGIKNYESLRLAFVDPVARIKSQSDINEIERSLNDRIFIDELKVDGTNIGKDGKTKTINKTLKFSPHLNVVIGGRSSGKSLLIDILGRKFTGVSQNDLGADYHYDTTKHSIKSNKDNDFIPQTNVTNSSLIYLTQHRIVNYFIENNLKDLAKKSNKGDEYDESLRKFSDEKAVVKYIADNIADKYAQVEPLKNAQYKIHQKDIDAVKLDGWSFKPINITKNTLNFEPLEQVLSALESNIELFKNNEFWRFTSDEKDVIVAFQQILKSKRVIKDKTQKHIITKNSFLDEVEAIRLSSNNGIDLNAQKKQTAQRAIDTVAENAGITFNKFYQLKKSCKEAEAKNLFFETSMEMSDGIKLMQETMGVEKDLTMEKLILNDVFLQKQQTENKKLYPTMISFPDVKHRQPFASKLKNVLAEVDKAFDNPKDSLIYPGESSSKNNSPGLNSEQYLRTILSNNNVQIIVIDQPEDNLGTTFISGTAGSLVELIRKEKLKKQIFLSTHNASVVVFGDAESIILSKNENNKIEYSQILMEDTENAKETICANLDGGYEVFDNRSRKYNIKKIIKN
ncbi:MAG: hypothetical protein PHI50_01850 [Alphaproteobacteria bacterium]|nr:hypothetical protein [Alphaproteobacteria bacterium]